MSIPLAVAASVKSPGLYLSINLLAGAVSPGSSTKRALLLASQSTSGTMTDDTEVSEAVAGPDAVKTLLGTGTPGHLAAKALFAEYGLAQVDVCSPAESTGSAAAEDITFASGPPTVSWTVTCHIAGREIEIEWTAGETDTQGADKLEAAINALGDDLPVTSANVAGVLTVTSKLKGLIGNDIPIRVVATGGTGGTVTAGSGLLNGGTLDADFTTALTTVKNKEYDYICSVVSNADAQDGSSTSNPGRVETHIQAYNTGRSAKLQQQIVGITGSLANAKTGTGNLNAGTSQYVFCLEGESLGAEFGGAECGARLREVGLDPAANRIALNYKATLYGAADLVADTPTDVEVEDALNYGVSICEYDAASKLRPARPITTYHKDSGGNADDRLLDTSRVDGIYAVSKDLRIALPQEFPNAKLSEDLEAADEFLPEGVVEVRDIRAFVNQRMRYWIRVGVVKLAEWVEAFTNGQFIVRVNPSDDSQCDIVLPAQIVPPLAKFSVVVQHTGT
jgi:phage tail sheath gpL-like